MLIVPNEGFALSRKPHSFRLRKSHVLFPINKEIHSFFSEIPSSSSSSPYHKTKRISSRRRLRADLSNGMAGCRIPFHLKPFQQSIRRKPFQQQSKRPSICISLTVSARGSLLLVIQLGPILPHPLPSINQWNPQKRKKFFALNTFFASRGPTTDRNGHQKAGSFYDRKRICFLLAHVFLKGLHLWKSSFAPCIELNHSFHRG